MLKRIVLIFLVSFSTLWLGYVAFEIQQGQKQLDPTQLFSAEDEELVLLLRPEECLIDLIPALINSPLGPLVDEVNSAGYDHAYFSKSRPHALFVKHQTWDQEAIRELFTDASKLTLDGYNFTYGNYTGVYYKTKLYLSEGKINSKQPLNNLVFDKKASAVVLDLKNADGKYSRTEYYFKENGYSTYQSSASEQVLGKKINDEALFSKYLSSDLEEYHFWNGEFCSTVDSVFANGPMLLWLDKGFVEITIDGKTALISDYLEGQDPDLVLSDYTQSFDTNRFDAPLTGSFPTKGKSYTFKFLDNLIVFAESENTVDKILSDYRLGNTIAFKSELRAILYNKLPKLVSERKYSSKDVYATSVYKGSIHESHLYTDQKISKTQTSSKTPLSRSIGEDVFDFWSDQKTGTCFIIGQNGKAALFNHDKLTWSKDLKGKPLTHIQVADIFDNGKTYFYFCTDQELHVYDQSGISPTGFPVKLDEASSADPTFYRWKGNANFLVPLGTKLYHFDAKGRELNVYNLAITTDTKPIVWASQSKLFAGVSGEGNFVMYEIEKRREYRKFNLDIDHARLKFPNEVFHFVLTNGNLMKIDQKGIRTYLDKREGTFVFSEHELLRSLLIKEGNTLTLTNENGIPYGKIDLPINDLNSLDVTQTESGKTVVAFLDGLENNVYLYLSDGSKICSAPLEGQKKVLLEAGNQGLIVSTVVDQFVVSYYLNY